MSWCGVLERVLHVKHPTATLHLAPLVPHHVFPFLHGLPYPQIHHDLLAPPRNSVRPDVPVQALHLLALPPPDVRRASEDLRRLTSAVLENLCGLIR